MLTSNLSTISDDLAKYTENGDGDFYCLECSKNSHDVNVSIWYGLDPYQENDTGEALQCSQCGHDILSLWDIDQTNAMIEKTNLMLEYCDQQYDDTSWF